MPQVFAFDLLRVRVVVSQAETDALAAAPSGHEITIQATVQGQNGQPLRNVSITIEKQ